MQNIVWSQIWSNSVGCKLSAKAPTGQSSPDSFLSSSALWSSQSVSECFTSVDLEVVFPSHAMSTDLLLSAFLSFHNSIEVAKESYWGNFSFRTVYHISPQMANMFHCWCVLLEYLFIVNFGCNHSFCETLMPAVIFDASLLMLSVSESAAGISSYMHHLIAAKDHNRVTYSRGMIKW